MFPWDTAYDTDHEITYSKRRIFPDSQEEEIKLFTEDLRRMIALQMKKAGGYIPPS